jgi:hypothetical protein
MPVVGEDCVECQIAFPPPKTQMPVETMYVFAHSDATLLEPPSHRVTISIDDHMPSGASRRSSAAGPQLGSFSDPKCPNTKSDENPTPLLVLQKCLQQLGINQLQSEYVIKNVKMSIDQAVDKPTQSMDPKSCDAHASTKKTSQRRDRDCALKGGGSKAITMMMCNLPCRATEVEIIAAIDSFGFSGTYEDVQLSRRHGQVDSNLGYGFVHFFRQADAARFARVFEGYRFDQRESSKACTVKVAKSQARKGKRFSVPSHMQQLQHASP